TDTGAGTNLKHWTMRSAGGNLYFATSSDAFATSTTPALTFLQGSGLAGSVGVATSSPWRTFSVEGTVAMNGLGTAQGNAICVTAGREITNPGATSCTGSSEKFKENIETLSRGLALEKINQLRVVSFDYKDGVYSTEDERGSFGLVAEEVQKVDRKLVDFNYDGEPTTLKFEKLTGLLIQSVQELDERVGFLESLGTGIANAIVRFKSLFAEEFTVGTPEKPAGITLYDKNSGLPYCLRVVNGSPVTSSGECSALANDSPPAPPPTPSPSPEPTPEPPPTPSPSPSPSPEPTPEPPPTPPSEPTPITSGSETTASTTPVSTTPESPPPAAASSENESTTTPEDVPL
ncbi:MAG: tail fiber domain-containing protein, partial [Nitrososphaera sp.]|nr:tail fiber domain-containing protein [Nitrososphaera sp.]